MFGAFFFSNRRQATETPKKWRGRKPRLGGNDGILLIASLEENAGNTGDSGGEQPLDAPYLHRLPVQDSVRRINESGNDRRHDANDARDQANQRRGRKANGIA